MLYNNTFVANLCRRQQYIVLRSSPKVADIFSTDFQKSPPISNCTEIRPVAATDGHEEAKRLFSTTLLTNLKFH